MSCHSQLLEALGRGDIAEYQRLVRRNDRLCDFIRGAVGVAAAVVFLLAVLLTANAALGSTPAPAVGQLAAWSTDTVPSVSVPSSPLVASSGGDGGGQASGLRSTVPTPAPESSPSDPPPQSGPDDGEGQPGTAGCLGEPSCASAAPTSGGGDASTCEGEGAPGDGTCSGDVATSPSPPLDEVWTCNQVTAGVATWLNAHTTYTDLQTDPDCARGGPHSDTPSDGTGSGPPPTTTTEPPYEGPVVLCEHPDIGSGTHIGSTCPDGWSPLGEPTVRTTTTTTVYEGPVIYCEHPQIGSGGFRADECPDGWTEMTS